MLFRYRHLDLLVKPLPSPSRLKKILPLPSGPGITKLLIINEFKRPIVPGPTSSAIIVLGKFFLWRLTSVAYVPLIVSQAS